MKISDVSNEVEIKRMGMDFDSMFRVSFVLFFAFWGLVLGVGLRSRIFATVVPGRGCDLLLDTWARNYTS